MKLWKQGGPTVVAEVILLACVGLAGIVAVLFAPEKRVGAGLRFSRGHHIDLGEVQAGEHKVGFEIENLGLTPLHLRSTSRSCGCTDVVVSNPEIAPGRSAKVTVVLRAVPESSRTVYVFFTFEGSQKTVEALSLRFGGKSSFAIVPEQPAVILECPFGGTRASGVVRCTVERQASAQATAKWSLDPAEEFSISRQEIVPASDRTEYAMHFESRVLRGGEVLGGVASLSMGGPTGAQCRVPIVIRVGNEVSHEPSVASVRIRAEQEMPVNGCEVSVHAPDNWEWVGWRCSPGLDVKDDSSGPSRKAIVRVVQRMGVTLHTGHVIAVLQRGESRIELKTTLAIEEEQAR